MQTGCLARHACPVGQAFRYRPAHAAFHMTAFAAKHYSPAVNLRDSASNVHE